MQDNKVRYGSIKSNLYRRRSSLDVYKTFLGEFCAATGAQLVILLGFLTALGIGGLIGVLPQVITQRVAELEFGLEDGIQCSDLKGEKPFACIQGSDYAQSAASYMMLARNLLALLSNSLAGSYSDTHGRKGIQILCLFLALGAPVSFLAIQLFPVVHPLWYYIFDCFAAIINPFSIGFTQLSDSLPPRHRAPANGLFMAAFMAGIAISPFLATLFSSVGITIFSAAVRFLALFIAMFCLPETLSKESQMEAFAQAKDENTTTLQLIFQPIRKLQILQRSLPIFLIALGAFTGKIVFSGDITLLFYYIESNLGATVHDVAQMMLASGILAVVVQGFLLKYLISLVGERRLLIASFGFGVAHNLFYGLAVNKSQIFVGICLSPFTNMNMPLISSFASRMVASTEQGQIQGALYGITSLAEAVGPLLFTFLHKTWNPLGPGTMFVMGALLYCLSIAAISMVPPKIVYEDDDESEDTPDGSQEEQEGLVL